MSKQIEETYVITNVSIVGSYPDVSGLQNVNIGDGRAMYWFGMKTSDLQKILDFGWMGRTIVVFATDGICDRLNIY